MLKVYIEWNVISQMKNGKHPDLYAILADNEDFFLPYSTSHITDILSSYKDDNSNDENICSDLMFLSKLTHDFFLFNSGKDIVFDFRNPQELFDKRVKDNRLFADFSLAEIHNEIGNASDSFDNRHSLIEQMKAIPVDLAFNEAFKNTKSAEFLGKMFPSLRQNLTFGGLLENISQMNNRMYNSDAYKDLRAMMQANLNINRDKVFDSKDPFALIQKSHDTIGLNYEQYINDRKVAPEWFSSISNDYIILDMHGYQEDKVNVNKGRKETFRNTTDDSFHAAFASTCNFFITNDTRSRNKTIKVYEKLGVNTHVLKPEEFVNYFNSYLKILDKSVYFDIISFVISNFEYFESKVENGTLRTFFFPYSIFNFFNKIMVYTTDSKDENIILLGQNLPTNGNVFLMEVRKLVSDLIDYLGSDLDNRGLVGDNEIINSAWFGRKWKFNDRTLNLLCPNGHFQLYIE